MKIKTTMPLLTLGTRTPAGSFYPVKENLKVFGPDSEIVRRSNKHGIFGELGPYTADTLTSAEDFTKVDASNVCVRTTNIRTSKNEDGSVTVYGDVEPYGPLKEAVTLVDGKNGIQGTMSVRGLKKLQADINEVESLTTIKANSLWEKVLWAPMIIAESLFNKASSIFNKHEEVIPAPKVIHSVMGDITAFDYMPSILNVAKVKELPTAGDIAPSTVYLVLNGGMIDIYISNQSGTKIMPSSNNVTARLLSSKSRG